MMIIRFSKKNRKKKRGKGGQMFMKWKYSSSMGCALEISYKAQWLSNHMGYKQYGVLQDVEMQNLQS